jgi:nicotinamidase-related amidase
MGFQSNRAGRDRPADRLHEPGGCGLVNLWPERYRAEPGAESHPAVHGVQAGRNDPSPSRRTTNPHDHQWKFEAPAETVQHKLGLFDRKGALTLDGFRNSGADFMKEFKPFIEDGKTLVASPHKLYGPQSNDLMLQLRKQRVDKIILAGMASNLCVESHLREFLERGFEVVVVRDAVAGPKLPDGDGYGSALVNFRYIANDVMTTDEVVKKLEGR